MNSLFLASQRSSFTSDFMNNKSKSSISEEIMGKYTLSRKDFIDSISGEKPPLLRNDFTHFKLTNIFTEPIKEQEENTNKTSKTNQTGVLELEESPIHGLMMDLMMESKPKKPSKKF